MSTEPVTTPVESTPVEDDLDAFSASFYGQEDAAAEPASSEESKEDTSEGKEDRDVSNDNKEDTQETETDNESDEVDEPEDDQKPKPKNRAQERISELNAKWREEQRRAAELEAKLAELQNPTKKSTQVTTEDAPSFDAKNEDGTPKYPLGEFDPAYVRDLASFSAKQQFNEFMRQQQTEKEAVQKATEQQMLVASWNEKLNPALERYPDFQEKAVELFDSITGLEPDYEDYISATIMQLDYGPDVLYYLSSHPEEARAIMYSGPTKSAVMLGRLEAKFAQAEAEKTLARPKVSKAPTPPPTNKGATAVKTSIAPDTDSLEDFEKLFNEPKRYG